MKKLLLSIALITSMSSFSQTTLFQENWDGSGPGISGWTLYNLDNLTPVGPIGTSGEPLSFLVQDAWSVLSLEEIQGATPGYTYPAGAVGMADNIIATNSWYTPAGIANDWLVSPQVTIPAGATNINLTWSAVSLASPAFLEDYKVYVSIGGGNAVSDFTLEVANIQNELSTGSARSVSLNGFAGLTIRFAFRNDSNDQYVMFVDNIAVSATLAAGVNDALSSKFKLYPNPANNIVTISNADNVLVNSVSITDLNGRTVMNHSFDSVSQTEMNVSNLTTGVYFVNIDTTEGIAVKRLVKN